MSSPALLPSLPSSSDLSPSSTGLNPPISLHSGPPSQPVLPDSAEPRRASSASGGAPRHTRSRSSSLPLPYRPLRTSSPNASHEMETISKIAEAIVDAAPKVSLTPPFPGSPHSSISKNHPESTLGPWKEVPWGYGAIKKWKILLVATAMNSFTQKVWSYLHQLGFMNVSLQLALSDQAIVDACESWNPHIVLCPFLTTRVPAAVYNKWMTLIVHPGPPGDAGPSSLDWILTGDKGSIQSEENAHRALMMEPTELRRLGRSHWGCIVFQANEFLDKGLVWCWDQYSLPQIGKLTKAQLYQGLHSNAALACVVKALFRVYKQVREVMNPDVTPGDQQTWVHAEPKDHWSVRCLSNNLPFMGGPTLERGLLRPQRRRPRWDIHCATDLVRIINAGDSQPGAQLPPLSEESNTALFAYGAHVHYKRATIPDCWTTLGYTEYQHIPNGTIVAHRDGAVFIKTKYCIEHHDREHPICGVGVWITHGRVPKKADKPLDPKIPMLDAIMQTGHRHVLDGIIEWPQTTFKYEQGTFQQVWVRTARQGEEIAQRVYWDFYNGAFSTANCKLLLSAIRWAVEADHGAKVKILALMGGPSYFSNGIALNTIEASSDPAVETWANINAIDDIVEYIIGCINPLRTDKMDGVIPLPKQNIITVACIRGNAAAGGVALAAACDIVMMGRGVILNPAYRAMGLHGSEFHSYVMHYNGVARANRRFSYPARCGDRMAAKLLTDMLPLNSAQAHKCHLIDIEIGKYNSTTDDLDTYATAQIREMLHMTAHALTGDYPSKSFFRCAPWSGLRGEGHPLESSMADTDLAEFMCRNKIEYLQNRSHPMLDHRTEELSQMLLDCFHKVRSWRYTKRRYDFIRKIKAQSTPARYVKHYTIKPDAEGLASFDDAPGWERGTEWAYVGMYPPINFAEAESTRVELFPAAETPKDQRGSPKFPGSSGSKGSSTDEDGEVNTPASNGKWRTVQTIWKSLSPSNSSKSLSPAASPAATTLAVPPVKGEGAAQFGEIAYASFASHTNLDWAMTERLDIPHRHRGQLVDCEFACLYQPSHSLDHRERWIEAQEDTISECNSAAAGAGAGAGAGLGLDVTISPSTSSVIGSVRTVWAGEYAN